MVNNDELKHLEQLNCGSQKKRLEILKQLASDENMTRTFPPETEEVNNHVHTSYSFSPYSPCASLWFARKAGLQAVGSMDHDSISAAGETLEAGKIMGMATTSGYEIRVNFSGTALEGRKLNNPDSANIAYIAVHGVPESRISDVEDFLQPIQDRRNSRNRKQLGLLNALIKPYGLPALDFDKDIWPLSEAENGGSITERHLLFALARSIVEARGRGPACLDFLQNVLGLGELDKNPVILSRLQNRENPHYLYDLLGVLKGNFLPRFFIQPDEKECLSVYDAVEFANGISAIPCYAYLGDVGESPTGDKKAEKFEDDYLDDLIPGLLAIGFKGLSYMPPRNTLTQLKRVQGLCVKYGLMEISGVDINSSRQSFNCPEILRPEFAHLVTATWALIAHEKLASVKTGWGLFHRDNPLAGLGLNERIKRYASWGKAMDRHQPGSIQFLADWQL